MRGNGLCHRAHVPGELSCCQLLFVLFFRVVTFSASLRRPGHIASRLHLCGLEAQRHSDGRFSARSLHVRPQGRVSRSLLHRCCHHLSRHCPRVHSGRKCPTESTPAGHHLLSSTLIFVLNRNWCAKFACPKSRPPSSTSLDSSWPSTPSQSSGPSSSSKTSVDHHLRQLANPVARHLTCHLLLETGGILSNPELLLDRLSPSWSDVHDQVLLHLPGKFLALGTGKFAGP